MQEKKNIIMLALFAIIVASTSFSAYNEFVETQTADFTPVAEINMLQGVGGNDCLLPSHEQTRIDCRQEKVTLFLFALPLKKNNELFGIASFLLLLYVAREFCLLRLRNTLYPFHVFW